ncbi:MAG: transporter permease [Acidimicrobiales bacterium]|jgi:lipopolysaccharide transport system permease protein|nr:transporter permease [Acidimicrobiales bacterium]
MTMPRPADDVVERPRPRLTIAPRRTWLPRNPRELWEFRSLLTRLAARDVTLRYRQTALGVTWVVLQPLLGAGILAFVFGRVAKLPGPRGVPYFVFSLTGMVAWTAFSQVATRASTSLVSNAQLVSKVFFPRLLLPLSTVLSTLIDVVVSLALLGALLVAYGVPLRSSILLLPVWIVLIISAALGIGMAAGAMMVRYRDVQYLLPVAVQFLLYASPVAYALRAVPLGARGVYEANPLTGLLEGVRWSVLNSPRPSAGLVAYAASASILLLLAGLLFFNRVERQFADVI